MQALREGIEYHDHLYYVKNKPEISDAVYRVDENGKRLGGRVIVYFLNRQLDPRRHSEPVRFTFELEGGESGRGARREVEVGLSGETFIRRPGQ